MVHLARSGTLAPCKPRNALAANDPGWPCATCAAPQCRIHGICACLQTAERNARLFARVRQSDGIVVRRVAPGHHHPRRLLKTKSFCGEIVPPGSCLKQSGTVCSFFVFTKTRHRLGSQHALTRTVRNPPLDIRFLLKCGRALRLRTQQDPRPHEASSLYLHGASFLNLERVA